MSRVAIFVEGQSELIFLRHCLPLVLGWDKISFECWELYANRMNPVSHKHTNKDAETHFWILNVGNDERVLSAVKEREEWLIQKGYEKIIALRDMYSEAYCNRSGGEINDATTADFRKAWQETIQKMSNPDKIKVHAAIMELEAWFLGMYNLFERLNPALNINYIEEKLGFNLNIIDPQTEFFKPADIVDNILQLVRLPYKKSEHDVESICSKIDINDFPTAFANGRCISFKNFYDELLN